MNYSNYRVNVPYGLSMIEKERLHRENKAKLEAFVGTLTEHESFKKQLQDEMREKGKLINDIYNKEDKRITDLFWKDAFEELGIDPNHPKAGLLKSKAWENGYSAGYPGVFTWLDDLSELI